MVAETTAMVEVTGEGMAEEKEVEKVVAMVPMSRRGSPAREELT